MKLAFFNFKFGTKWIDYWLRKLEERGNAQKRTLTILLYIYSVSITIEKSGRHWPMCEYCSHEAAAACIDDDIKKVVERLLCNIWVHTQGQESASGEWQETFSFSQYQIQNDSGQCPVVCKYAPRVILKPLPTARLWETRKFLHLVREFIKMSGLFCLFSFSANRLKSRWRSPAYYQSPWGTTSDQGGNTREWLGFGVWPTILKMVSRNCGTVRTRSMVCCAQLGTRKLWCAYIRRNYFCNVLDAHINMLRFVLL